MRSRGTVTCDFGCTGGWMKELKFSGGTSSTWSTLPLLNFLFSWLTGLYSLRAFPPACLLRVRGEIDLIWFLRTWYEFTSIRFFAWSSEVMIVFEVIFSFKRGPMTCLTWIKWFARTSSTNLSCSWATFWALNEGNLLLSWLALRPFIYEVPCLNSLSKSVSRIEFIGNWSKGREASLIRLSSGGKF